MVQTSVDDVELVAYALLGSLEDGFGISPSSPMKRRIWGRLPHELLERILKFLPAKSICRLRVVCKEWRRLLTSANFFRTKEELCPLWPLICSLDADEQEGEGDAPPQHCVPVNTPREWRSVLSYVSKEFLDDIPLEKGWEDYNWHWTLHREVDCGDGLVCLHRGVRSSRYIVVVNPGTSTFRLLPRVPSKCYGRGLGYSMRLKLDEPFGTTFTLAWHTKVFSKRNTVTWAVGIYSSQTDEWNICEERRPAERDESAFGNFGALVHDGLLFRLHLHSSGYDQHKCVWYTFDNGGFTRVGESAIPQVVVSYVQQEEDVHSGTDWLFVESCGAVYLIARVLANPGNRLHGFGIWKLDLGSSKFEQVAVTSGDLIEQLGFPEMDAFICNACAVGDFICLVVSTHLQSVQTRRYATPGLKHVVAFHVPQQTWHVLYMETDDDERLVPLPEGYYYSEDSDDEDFASRFPSVARPKCHGGRTFLPSYPLMRPNYYFHVNT